MDKEKILTVNDAQYDFEVGEEFAYHQAILSLRKIHGYGSETIQTIVGLIYRAANLDSPPRDDSEEIDEKRNFADWYTDYLIEEKDLVEMYSQSGVDFLIDAVLCFGGFNPETAN